MCRVSMAQALLVPSATDCTGEPMDRRTMMPGAPAAEIGSHLRSRLHRDGPRALLLLHRCDPWDTWALAHATGRDDPWVPLPGAQDAARLAEAASGGRRAAAWPLSAAGAHDLRRLVGLVGALDRQAEHLHARVRAVHEELRDRVVRRAVAARPVGELLTHGCRPADLAAIGATEATPIGQLGIDRRADDQARSRLTAARAEVERDARADPRNVPWLRTDDPASVELITLLHQIRAVESRAPGRALRTAVQVWAPLAAHVETPADVVVLLQLLAPDRVAPPPPTMTRRELALLAETVSRAPDPAAAVADFEAHAVDYATLLGRLVDRPVSVDPGHGTVPAEVLDRIDRQELDQSLTAGRLELRRYQSFGARFALTQRRVLIADAPGLGKTAQSIAVAAHVLATTPPARCLVVAPLAVLTNWQAEVVRFSRILPIVCHGARRAATWEEWATTGGLLLTTYESLRALDADAVDPDLLVVDEAHAVKNPGTIRTDAVRRLAARSARVVLLTGTPLENRVEDLAHLLEIVDPHVGRATSGLAGRPGGLRELIAPHYLRRRADEVLDELPPLAVIDELVPLGDEQAQAYRTAVAAGSFMAMRQAAFAPSPSPAAKLLRIGEISDAALAAGRSVLVCSYFRGVLGAVAQHLGERVAGEVTGDTPAARRFELAAGLGRERPGVLLAQVDAGGTGLNVTGASVVVLCEPQLKPSTEIQAIARAHRMGQTREVFVHRLVTAESVESRIVDLLRDKQQAFDAYADRSVLAELSPEAVDPRLSPAVLVQEEQARLRAEGPAPSADPHIDVHGGTR